MAGITDLIVWREAASLAAEVTRAAGGITGPAAPTIIDQLVRAANSIPANIAEGYGRGVTRDCIRFLRIAHASADELESHLRVAGTSGRIPLETAEALIEHTRRVGYLIHRFEQSVERRRKRRPLLRP